MEIGALVRQLREGRGWSQGELARRSGVAQPTISQIESGYIREPGHDTIRRLAETLEADVGPLLAALGIPAREGPAGHPALQDLIAWIEARSDLFDELEAVRRENDPAVYRVFLEGLAGAWESNLRLAMRIFRLRDDQEGDDRG